MASKSRRTPNFSEEEKLLVAEFGREFPEVESKGYDNKTLRKKANAWEEILKDKVYHTVMEEQRLNNQYSWLNMG